MCLAIPMQIVKIEGSFADVKTGGIKRRVNVDMLPNIKRGDFVMVHTGFAIQRVDAKEAKKTLEAIGELYHEIR